MKRPAKPTPTVANLILIADTAWAALSEMQPAWSIDALLLHPSSAMDVCRTVRRQLHVNARDHEILGALLNGRKRGWIEPKGSRLRRPQ